MAVQERLRNFYIPEITSIKYEGQDVEAPQPVTWYPDQLAWYMTTPKQVIRRFKPFASFQKFLVAETDVGNINRQEVVSMIPPLCMDLRPGMTVLDLCAAPGSKSAQLIEMIHAGEEERAREVASHLANGLDRPQGEDYEDDGRSTGLLVANDVDYRRAHMLVHQMKRLSSPNIIVTNHDATIYPSIKIPSLPNTDGKPVPNRYLKFDRILADVPCSGDGTPRKNVEIWKNWTPSNGLGLHLTQVRILVRALQMLKVGGRVVYSTCSMNPVEDEAVLAAAIDRCGGPDLVQILETKDYLPGLKRYPGLTQWSIMDKSGRMWDSWESVLSQRSEHGDDGLGRLQESMFPPKTALALDRAIRVYPHQQDTGAFFIAVLEKKSEIKARSEEKTAIAPEKVKVQAADSNGTTAQLETTAEGRVTQVRSALPAVEDAAVDESPAKRKRSVDDEDGGAQLKRIKSNEEVTQSKDGTPTAQSAATAPADVAAPAPTSDGDAKPATSISEPTNIDLQQAKRKQRDQPFEEPFKYLDPEIPELELIRKFYTIHPRFPQDRFMVRNAEARATKNIYYTTALAKDILQENEGKGMKFVHSGVKMFVKQDAPAPEVCPWRIQTDGLRILETWVGKGRVIKLTKKETLRKLLIEMFPRFHGDDWKNLAEIGEQVRNMGMGCCVLVVEPTNTEDGFNERMVFPLWKSIQSLNLMLPKEERKAMLLRIFNDDTPLVNNSHGFKKSAGKKEDPIELKVEESKDSAMDVDVPETNERRNSSSPEPAPVGEETNVGSVGASEDDEDGGVKIES